MGLVSQLSKCPPNLKFFPFKEADKQLCLNEELKKSPEKDLIYSEIADPENTKTEITEPENTVSEITEPEITNTEKATVVDIHHSTLVKYIT